MPRPLGLEPGVVRLVPYDPAWPLLFHQERERLTVVSAPLRLVLEHTGSTAVPGLAAKPVLDMLAGFPAEAAPGPYVAALIRAGYEHRGERGIPGREFFRRGRPRAYHVHLARVGSAFWREHLAFRDYLRAHAPVRDEYARLKAVLAARHPRDREAYVEGKGPFIRDVLRHAASSLPATPGA